MRALQSLALALASIILAMTAALVIIHAPRDLPQPVASAMPWVAR